jgi:hypothetical protein
LQQEQAGLANPLTDLTASVTKNSALAESQKALSALTNKSAEAANQAMMREVDAGQLRQEVATLLTAAQQRQSALENAARAATTEGTRWNTYYAARVARAQTECAITGQGPTPPPAAAPIAPTSPRPAPARRPAQKRAE